MSITYRYKSVEYNDASAETKAIYDETMKQMGIPFVLNWFKCQGENPVLLRGNWEKLKSTMLMGQIPFLLKQMIIYNISQENDCRYCAYVHGMIANKLSNLLTEAEGFQVTDDMDSDYIPKSYKVAVSVVTKAGTRPKEITDDDFNRLREASFSDQEIQELLALADLTNMLNTMAEVSGITVDNELMEAQ